MASKNVGHPKRKKKVKGAPEISPWDIVVTEAEWKAWALNSLRRETIVLRKTAVKTAAKKDEIINLCKKDAFLIAALKSLHYIPEDYPEFCRREGYEHLFVQPEKKASETIIWDKSNLPPDNPIYPNKSVFCVLENEAKARFIGCYNYERGCFVNREGKEARNIVAHYPLNSGHNPVQKTEE